MEIVRRLSLPQITYFFVNGKPKCCFRNDLQYIYSIATPQTFHPAFVDQVPIATEYRHALSRAQILRNLTTCTDLWRRTEREELTRRVTSNTPAWWFSVDQTVPLLFERWHRRNHRQRDSSTIVGLLSARLQAYYREIRLNLNTKRRAESERVNEWHSGTNWGASPVSKHGMRIMSNTVEHCWIAEEERSPFLKRDLQRMVFVHSSKKRSKFPITFLEGSSYFCTSFFASSNWSLMPNFWK